MVSQAQSSSLRITGATIVTMNDAFEVIEGDVLVRNGRIVAVWSGPTPPDGVVVGDASVVAAGLSISSFQG